MASGTGKLTIKVGSSTGKSDSIMDVFDEIVVDTSLHVPDMFTIRLNDNASDKPFMENDAFELGTVIEIKAEPSADMDGDADLLIPARTPVAPGFLDHDQLRRGGGDRKGEKQQRRNVVC